MIEVEVGNAVVEFPDGTPEEEIRSALDRQFRPDGRSRGQARLDMLQEQKALREQAKGLGMFSEDPDAPAKAPGGVLSQAGMGIAQGYAQMGQAGNRLLAETVGRIHPAVREQFLGASQVAGRAAGEVEQMAQQTEGPEIVRHLASGVIQSSPALAAAPAGFGAMVGTGMAQGYGAALPNFEQQYFEQDPAAGMEDATSRAQLPAMFSGAVSGLVTRIMGRTGIESLSVKPMLREGLRKAFGNEATEEWLTAVAQGAIEKKMVNPDLSWGEVAENAAMEGFVGGFAGLGMEGMKAAGVGPTYGDLKESWRGSADQVSYDEAVDARVGEAKGQLGVALTRLADDMQLLRAAPDHETRMKLWNDVYRSMFRTAQAYSAKGVKTAEEYAQRIGITANDLVKRAWQDSQSMPEPGGLERTQDLNFESPEMLATMIPPLPDEPGYNVVSAPLRVDQLKEMSTKEMAVRAESAKFLHHQQNAQDVANAYDIEIGSRQPMIGGWVEGGTVSLEVPEVVEFKTNDPEVAMEIAGLMGALAPELQNSAFMVRDEVGGPVPALRLVAKSKAKAMDFAKQLEQSGVQGYSYDPKSREFSIYLTNLKNEASHNEIIKRITEDGVSEGFIRPGFRTTGATAEQIFEDDYPKFVQSARDRGIRIGGERGRQLLQIAEKAERRIERYNRAKEVAQDAAVAIGTFPMNRVAAASVEQDAEGVEFENIRHFANWLDQRFRKLHKIKSFKTNSKVGIEQASEALAYDILEDLTKNGSGMGWYDWTIGETWGEFMKIFPHLAHDPNELAVMTAITAITSQGYNVTQNFKIADEIYRKYKLTGRIPTDNKLAKAAPAINSNLKLLQGLIDELGLDHAVELMDKEVTGRELRDLYGMKVDGVTLEDVVRGNRVLGPKIGSFFNNLRGNFDTITMDLWYTRTMHRYIGEAVEPMSSPRSQEIINEFRDLVTSGKAKRNYGVNLEAAVKSDKKLVAAGMEIFRKWSQPNQYSEKGFNKFPDEYPLEKAARKIATVLGMKGAPQNKKYRTMFENIVKAAQTKLAERGVNLSFADMQAIIWYREKRLFDKLGLANSNARPADYLDAVMQLRKKYEEENVDVIGHVSDKVRRQVLRAVESVQ